MSTRAVLTDFEDLCVPVHLSCGPLIPCAGLKGLEQRLMRLTYQSDSDWALLMSRPPAALTLLTQDHSKYDHNSLADLLLVGVQITHIDEFTRCVAPE